MIDDEIPEAGSGRPLEWSRAVVARLRQKYGRNQDQDVRVVKVMFDNRPGAEEGPEEYADRILGMLE